ncbi:chromate efflux transporter [Franzmannia qiaohouensis]|uniref:Chromate efflux transporter n=1 Tax=Franzmannia qiaohouensis TaxID=1329370 RepID=A0ABU1HE96_9GAMM|nr:chromate efflux transporter [Halomonas qiaohouensis]MDR5904920.1 chromate efflux transporter [Halomonas qiaohouensis]
MPPVNETPHQVPVREAVMVWLRIAMLSFGGPAGQIAVMHRILVEEKQWIGERRFLHALNYCMMLPGPEAQQLAIYIGWLMHRTKGGLVAGCLFVLPGFIAILALSFLYATLGNVGLVEGLFFGLKAAVLAVVLNAVVRIGKRALKNRIMLGLAAAAFVAIFFFDVAFPLIILSAALLGYWGGKRGMAAFQVGGSHGDGNDQGLSDRDSLLGEGLPAHARPNPGWSLRVSAIFVLLWLTPVVILLATLGSENVFSQIATFFSKMAVVTFGGAYAVLGYVTQEAVQNYAWLAPGEMLDGLGMAETTPGPLIQVVQFVGFMGAYREAIGLAPMLAATLAAVLTTWVTFVPCFLWIFLGAPYVERLRDNRALSAALSAITAAVVGVILNLAIWFGLHVIFAEVEEWHALGARLLIPDLTSLEPLALLLSAAAMLAIFRFKVGMLTVLGSCALLGVLFSLVF